MKVKAIGLRGLLLENKGIVLDLTGTDALSDGNLLAIFRIATLSRFVISVILFTVVPFMAEAQNLGRLVNALDALLLCVYLFATPLQRLLKAHYMLVALVWASVIPLFISSLTIYLMFTAPLHLQLPFSTQRAETFIVLSNIALNLPTLLIPLLIVSWRYSQKVIIWFCLGTSILDIAVLAVFVPIGRTNLIVAFSLILFRLVILGLVGLVVNHLITIQRLQAKALRDANTRLHDYAATRENLITSQERNRLARELHDTLAHTLAAATVQLEAVQVIWETQPERAKQLVQESAVTMRDGLQETRRALQALRAESLESIGFVASIHELAKSTQAGHGLDVTVNVTGSFAWLSNEQEHILYRITQEAIHNSTRHANAHHMTITLSANNNALSLSVVDDGVGFDGTNIDSYGHFGVQGMRERAEIIGANLSIGSEIGQGTTIHVKFERTPDADTHL